MPWIGRTGGSGTGTVTSSDVISIVETEYPNLDTDDRDDLTTATTDIVVEGSLKGTTISGVNYYGTGTVSGTHLYASNQLNASQMELTSPGSGLVLLSPDGNRWSLSITNVGNLQVREV